MVFVGDLFKEYFADDDNAVFGLMSYAEWVGYQDIIGVEPFFRSARVTFGATQSKNPSSVLPGDWCPKQPFFNRCLVKQPFPK